MMVHTRQAFGASWICAKHSCPQASFSGQREHSLNLNCPSPSVALKAAFPVATRTAAGWCVSGHQISLFPRNFKYVRRARRKPTTTRTVAPIANVRRMYFMVAPFGAASRTTRTKPAIAPFHRPLTIRLQAKHYSLIVTPSRKLAWAASTLL